MSSEIHKITLKECTSGYHLNGVTTALLENVSLEINKGELVALIGKNGSGKTTLLKTMVGLVPLIGGEIFFDELSLEELNPTELAKKTGFHSARIPENQEMIVEDLVRLGRYPYTNLFGTLNSSDQEIITHAMIVCGILHLRRKNLGQLSDGERQRAMLARVFAQDTDIILLDEPTSHLDIPNKYEILNLLQKLAHEGKTILFSTHDLNLASTYSDKLWLIHDRSIVEGAPEDIFLGSELKKQFETNKLTFDNETGEFTPKRSVSFWVNLCAEPNCKVNFKWTRKALHRKGFGLSSTNHPSNSPSVSINISKEKDTFVWNLVFNDSSSRSTSIYQLVTKLEKLIKNDIH